MDSLKEKTNERPDASWLSHPVTGRAAAPRHSTDERRDIAAFWLDGGFLCDDAEPLPSMFRSKTKTGEAELRPVKAGLAGSISLTGRLSKWNISNRTTPYIIASFLLLFAAADGFLLTASTFSADRRAPTGQASAALDQDGAETALMLSAPSSEAAEGSRTPPLAPGREALAEGGSWSAAVEALEQLLAEKKTYQAAAMKQAENERLIGRLEQWVNARAKKPAAVAEACTAPARQCWKAATLVR